jgi:signal transduction histidine kinase
VEAMAEDVLLIVDDSPANLKVLFDCLDDAGFEVVVAKDGESALQKVAQSPPDLILLDVMMPGIDGFETCRRLKANPDSKDIPVIFMTALSDTVDKVTGLSLGAVDYITKPFQQEEVLARVKVHLQLRKEIKQRAAAEAELAKLNQKLEKLVSERTAKLKRTIQQLKEAQIQLVQKEKMSIIGQLTAGVAHEINNPLSFISGNLNHAESYIKELIAHLQLYQEKLPYPGAEIAEHAEDIDLEFLLKDLCQMISSMKMGTDRIAQISVSLRNFSRSDREKKVATDIYEGIDSTLMMLKHRLQANKNRPKIEIVKEYRSLPLLECYPGQLNQVFMNIMANAIDVFDEYSRGRDYQEILAHPNIITISTEANSEEVTIRIKDNGPGMSPEVQQQVFEYLFTTKPLGKGTGLGLSISRKIIEEKHGGKLTVNSAPGQGAEFAIVLPLNG